MGVRARSYRNGFAFLSLAVGCAAGCSSSAGTPAPVAGVRGTYEATTAGAYLRITFYDEQHYFLFRSPCDLSTAEGANGCLESGTYTLGAGDDSISLGDVNGGAAVTLPFVPGPLASAVAAPQAVDIQGGVSLTSGDGGSLTSGEGGALTTGDGGALTAADGGALTGEGGVALSGDGGPLTAASGVPLAGFTMNGQGFASAPESDGGVAGDDAGGVAAGSAGAGDAGRAAGSGSGSGSSGATGSGTGGGAASSAGSCTAGSHGASQTACGGGGSSVTVSLLYEGTCAFLEKNSVWSKGLPAGDVLWGCDGQRPCSDSDPWMAGPSRSYCTKNTGKPVTVCTSSGRCTAGTVRDTSNVKGWEAGNAVMKALGLPLGTARGVTITY